MKKNLACLVAFTAVSSVLSVLGGATSTRAASFRGLGDLPGGSFNSSALGVSADGSVVVGHSISSSGQEAFRWTESGGMVGLGDLPGGSFLSDAIGVSADGSVVVGHSNSSSGQEAFRWTESGGMVGLGDLPGGSFLSGAIGASADGSVVVGHSISSGLALLEAFRWTESGGMVGLGDLPGGSFWSQALGVSADGSVVVGGSSSSSSSLGGGREAFRWTESGGMVGLGDLPGGSFDSRAFRVSADGSVVVGTSNSSSGQEAFRWTESGGMVGLGDLPGGSFDSRAFGVSADGSVVIGKSDSSSIISQAFIWDETNGMRSLQNLLASEGIDLTGWILAEAWGISSDGLSIVGFGINPDGNWEAWLAQLDSNPDPESVPEPSAVGGLSLALGLAALFLKQKFR